MANEDIVFRAKVDEGGKGAKSLADYKKEFKELQKELSKTQEGTEAYLKTLQKLGAVKDDMGDLRATIDALNPEGKVRAFADVAGKLAGGFQAATGAAALFGVESEELQKTLLKVQAATAFADGIQSIAALGDSFRVVGTVIKTHVVTALTTLKGAIIATGIGALAVAIGVLIAKTQEYNEEIEEQYGRQQKLNEELKKTTEEYLKQAVASEELRNRRKGGLNELEREIKLLEASGAKAEEIAQKKLEAFDKEIYNLKVTRATIFDNAEESAKITEKILDKEAEKQAFILATEKTRRDEAAKTAQALREERDRQEVADYEAAQRKLEKERAENEKAYERLQKEREDKKKQEEKDAEELLKKEEEARKREELAIEYSKKSREQARKELEAEELATAQRIAAGKIALDQATFKTAQNLSNAFFTSQLNKAKGNAQAEVEIRKKQFQVEKAFGVTRATIDGYRSVVSALTIPPPLGQILAAANAAAAAAQIASILATKFDGGNVNIGSVTPPTVSAPVSSPDIAPPSAPTINTTRFNEQGQNLSINVKAEVVETEMTKKQKTVQRLSNQAKF